MHLIMLGQYNIGLAHCVVDQRRFNVTLSLTVETYDGDIVEK